MSKYTERQCGTCDHWALHKCEIKQVPTQRTEKPCERYELDYICSCETEKEADNVISGIISRIADSLSFFLDGKKGFDESFDSIDMAFSILKYSVEYYADNFIPIGTQLELWRQLWMM